MSEIVKTELQWHIEKFPSDFDGTAIAKQLLDDGVSVKTYADVRDILWRQLKCYKAELKDLKSWLRDTISEINSLI